MTMADATDRYALPLIQTGQAQKDVTHNDAVATIDTLLHLAVDGILAAPPPTPVVGQSWIVAPGATGAWASHGGHVMAFTSAGWTEIVPRDGCTAWVKAAAVFALFSQGSWAVGNWPVKTLTIGGRTVLGNPAAAIADPRGGSVVDVEARAGVAAILSALRSLGLLTA